MQRHNVALATDMPIWSAPTGADAAFARVSVARALQAGLAVRAIKDTVCDTLAWYLQRPEPERLALKAGIDPAREHDLIETTAAGRLRVSMAGFPVLDAVVADLAA